MLEGFGKTPRASIRIAGGEKLKSNSGAANEGAQAEMRRSASAKITNQGVEISQGHPSGEKRD